MQYLTGAWISACIALFLLIDLVMGRSLDFSSTVGLYVAMGGAILGFILYRRSKEQAFATPYMPTALALYFLALMLGMQAHGDRAQIAFAIIAGIGALIATYWAERARVAVLPKK